MAVSSFRQLNVWRKSFALAQKIYNLCESIPDREQFGLINQMQRAAVSIPSNIAEGQQRNSRKEYRQFIGMAKGSAAELETQLLLVESIYDVKSHQIRDELTDIQKMLHSLNARLHTKPITNNQ